MNTTPNLGNENSLSYVETTFVTEEVLKTSDSITSNTLSPYLPNFQDFSMGPQITENFFKPVEFLPPSLHPTRPKSIKSSNFWL